MACTVVHDLFRINGHIPDARPRLILLPDCPPMPKLWPARMEAVLAALVRDFGHVIVFSGQIIKSGAPGRAQCYPKWG